MVEMVGRTTELAIAFNEYAKKFETSKYYSITEEFEEEVENIVPTILDILYTRQINEDVQNYNYERMQSYQSSSLILAHHIYYVAELTNYEKNPTVLNFFLEKNTTFEIMLYLFKNFYHDIFIIELIVKWLNSLYVEGLDGIEENIHQIMCERYEDDFNENTVLKLSNGEEYKYQELLEDYIKRLLQVKEYVYQYTLNDRFNFIEPQEPENIEFKYFIL